MSASDFIKGKIIAFLESGFSIREVAAFLQISPTTVQRIENEARFGSIEAGVSEKRGRKTSLNSNEREILSEISLNSPFLNSREISSKLAQKIQKEISSSTVRRHLQLSGIKCRSARLKPKLSDKNKDKIFKLTCLFLGFSNTSWKSVIFSDETYFELKPQRKRTLVYRKQETALNKKNIVETNKFGGRKLMFWGCISWHGTGNLVLCENKLNSGLYINLLANNLEESAEKMQLKNFTFQQDGASCHTSKITKDFMNQKGFSLLDWVPQSSDLNPIENIWLLMKRRLRKNPPKNLTDLKNKVMLMWKEITIEECRKLIESMPRRAYQVYLAKGGHTKY